MLNYPVVNDHADLTKVVDLILSEVGLDRSEQGGRLTFAGMDPIRPTHIKVGSLSAAVTAANAVANRDTLASPNRTGPRYPRRPEKGLCDAERVAGCSGAMHAGQGTPQMFGGNVGQLGSNILPTRDGRWVVLTSLHAANTVAAL